MAGFPKADGFSRRSADGRAEFFERKLARAAERYQFSLLIHDHRCRGWNVGCNLGRNVQNTMNVAVQKVARLDLEAGNFHRSADLHDVSVGVRNRDAGAEEMKARGSDGGDVTDGTVRERAHAAEGEQD